MPERKKPQDDIVALAGRAMTHPESLTGSDIKRMAAHILDDQRKSPERNAKPSVAAQVIAKVGGLIPDALKPSEAGKSKPAAPKAVDRTETSKSKAPSKPKAQAASRKPTPKSAPRPQR